MGAPRIVDKEAHGRWLHLHGEQAAKQVGRSDATERCGQCRVHECIDASTVDKWRLRCGFYHVELAGAQREAVAKLLGQDDRCLIVATNQARKCDRGVLRGGCVGTLRVGVVCVDDHLVYLD